MSPGLNDRLAGAVWGHLVGDAMGVPYEFSAPGSITDVVWGHNGSHRQPPGTWSDDGALMLALLDSLLTAGFDLDDQGRRALSWRASGAYAPGGKVFDIGGTTGVALGRVAAGTPAAQAGDSGEGQNGNGSLMRILPIALVGRAESRETLVAQAAAGSAMTHAHPRSQVCCAVYVLIAHDLLLGATDLQDVLARAFDTARDDLPAENLAELDLVQQYPQRTGGGYVVDSFWSAWDAFAGASSYADTIERAIRYGKDTDTTACIAGGLAGLHWGIDAIPSQWRDGMRDQETVTPIVQRLLASSQ